MAEDRVGGDDIPLTHDLLWVMLGVRRPDLTDTLHRLEGDHMIKARRGKITIKNCDLLLASADDFYGVPGAAYERMLDNF